MATKTESLPRLGVSTFGIIHAGQIQALLQMQEEFSEKVKASVSEHSFAIAIDIAEFLIKKVTPATETLLREYLNKENILISWVKNAMTWTSAGVLLGSTSLVEIKKTDLANLEMNKQEFLDYLNKVWHKYALLNDWKDSDDTVNFIFNLQV